MGKVRRTPVKIALVTALLMGLLVYLFAAGTRYTPQHEITALEDGWETLVQGRTIATDRLEDLSLAANLTLKRGDKVVTAGGIYGIVDEMKERSVLIKVDGDVKLRVDKNSIVRDFTEDAPKA